MASPTATAPASAGELLDLVRRSGIHPPEYLGDKLAEFELPADAPGAAAALVRGGLLTQFQARLLLAGKYRGFKLGTYVVRDILGKGGMGVVYLAEHASLRRKVALKVFTPGSGSPRAGVERFLREARAAAALDHPNIVRVFDVLETGELHYLVMEYVDGKTLEDVVVAGGAMAPGRAVGYISQAAAGLQHAYEKGFVHRDIKPANLMVAKDGTVKLLDMGLARSVVDSTDRVTEVLDRGAVVGTADYISPEQAMNAPGLDIRADIYSLGATLYALVAGRPPFAGSTSQVLMQHQFKEPPSLADIDRTIPVELAAVVAKMMAKKPADRFATPAEVIAALAPWLPNRDGAQRVLAGLSGSEMSRSTGNLRNTIDQVMSNSSTGRLVPLTEARAAGKSRLPLLVGGGAVLAAAVGVAVYLAVGRPGDPAVATANSAAVSPAAATPTGPGRATAAGKPAAKPAGRPAPAAGRVTDFAGVAEATHPVEGGGSFFTGRFAGATLPAGWIASHYGRQSASEFRAADVGGVRAVGLRLTRGESGCQFKARPEVFADQLAAGAPLTIRMTYRCDGPGDGKLAVQRDVAPYTRYVTAPLPPTGGGWREAELTFRRETDEPVALVVEPPPAAAGDNTLWVKQVRFGGSPDAPDAPAAVAPPAGRRLVGFDFAGLDPFRRRFADGQPDGDGPAGHNGVSWFCWKPESVAEFRGEATDAGPAIGVTNLNDPVSSQVRFALDESAPGGGLAAGKRYVLRVEYRTANDAAGKLQVRTPDYQPVASAPLPGTGGGWKWAELPFARPGARLDAVVENTAVGEGNALWVRAAEVCEGN
jgi:serine/threonine protein kinase